MALLPHREVQNGLNPQEIERVVREIVSEILNSK